jgi:hypothetical protein
MDTMNASWRKSTRSGGNGGDCVEVADATGRVLVRDTKDHDNGPVLSFPAAEWNRFTRAIR